jgi:hypothetical protein
MKKCLYWLGATALVVNVACTKNSPARPSETVAAAAEDSVVTSVTANGVTLTTPRPTTPASGASVRFAEQPLTLTTRNASSTGAAPLTYTFQIASDAAFAAIAFSRDGVTEGGSGTTSVTADKLQGDRPYWWRVRANSGSAAGLFSAPSTFTLGPEVVLQAPVLVSPGNGGNFGGNAPLVVNNVSRSGPAGTISYRFEVADSSSFSNIVFTSTVNEGGGSQTQVTLNARLTTNATYFWRVIASDPSNGVTAPTSAVSSFRFVPFDMSQAIILNSPADLGSWPETSKITSINISPSWFQVEFDKRDGPGRWPDVVPAGWDGALQYTLGMCVNPNGNQWYCSAVVQFWHGRTLTDSAPPSAVGLEWFYDPGRWGAIHFYQPREGELVGLFAAAGNNRDAGNVTRASCPRVCERTNVALIPWTTGNANYVY